MAAGFFAHLHVHTKYSMLDGAARLKLVAAMVGDEFGRPSAPNRTPSTRWPSASPPSPGLAAHRTVVPTAVVTGRRGGQQQSGGHVRHDPPGRVPDGPAGAEIVPGLKDELWGFSTAVRLGPGNGRLRYGCQSGGDVEVRTERQAQGASGASTLSCWLVEIGGSGRSSDLVIYGSPYARLLYGAVSPSTTIEDVVALTHLLVNNYVPDASRWLDVLKSDDLLLLARETRQLSPGEQGSRIGERACELRARPTEVERFTLAHELCHLLLDREWGEALAVASGPWAPTAIEQRANAFAAAFLMPSWLLREAVVDLDEPMGDPQTIDAIARRLRVSHSSLVDRLFNLGEITADDRLRLRAYWAFGS